MQPLVDLIYEIDFTAEDIAFTYIKEYIIREARGVFSSKINAFSPNALLIINRFYSEDY